MYAATSNIQHPHPFWTDRRGQLSHSQKESHSMARRSNPICSSLARRGICLEVFLIDSSSGNLAQTSIDSIVFAMRVCVKQFLVRRKAVVIFSILYQCVE